MKNFDIEKVFHADTATFTTATITTLNGETVFTSGATFGDDVIITSSHTFTTGTGAVAINGDITIAATKGITKTAGAGNFDFSLGSGTFKTSYGANTLSGDTTIAGTKTFTTGTGAVTIKGNVSVDAGKTVTLGPTLQRTLTKTANYTVLDTDADIVFVGSLSAHATITLPTAADNTGRTISVIIAGDPGAFNVIVDGEGAETVNGAATKTNSDQYSVLEVTCNGTAWYIRNSIGTWT